VGSAEGAGEDEIEVQRFSTPKTDQRFDLLDTLFREWEIPLTLNNSIAIGDGFPVS
jgi:hypothetical protein